MPRDIRVLEAFTTKRQEEPVEVQEEVVEEDVVVAMIIVEAVVVMVAVAAAASPRRIWPMSRYVKEAMERRISKSKSSVFRLMNYCKCAWTI
jgi:hypothetical protein